MQTLNHNSPSPPQPPSSSVRPPLSLSFSLSLSPPSALEGDGRALCALTAEGRAPRFLLAPTNITTENSDDARRHQWGGRYFMNHE